MQKEGERETDVCKTDEWKVDWSEWLWLANDAWNI